MLETECGKLAQIHFVLDTGDKYIIMNPSNANISVERHSGPYDLEKNICTIEFEVYGNLPDKVIKA